MITKKSIAEQVQRIVNGGSTADDSKIAIQEVVALVEQERDAMIKKHILENSMLGDHEVPSAFLTKRRFDVALSSIYGVGGRPFVNLMHSPLSLPNDDAIYRVCSTPVRRISKYLDEYPTETVNSDKRKIVVSSFYNQENTSTPYLSDIEFKNKTGTTDIGNKFVFSFKHGYDSNTVKNYNFTFTYKNPSDRRNTSIVNQNSLNPQVLLMSLNNNKDFQDFLKVNKLKFTWADTSASGYWKMSFESHYSSQHLGIEDSNNFDFKSVLTNASIVDWHADGLTIRTTYSQAGGQNYPTLGFGITIEYSKNKRLKEMGADMHNIKAAGSTSLTTYIEITEEDIRVPSEGGYEDLAPLTLHTMWLNKYAGLLKMYGIVAVLEDGAIYIKEDHNHGGFDSVTFNGMTNMTGTITIPTIDTTSYTGIPVKDVAEKANYSEVECYSRMSNPGQFSMYDNAILLSGRKYWYRENKKIYLYNSDHKDFNDEGLEVTVWFIASSNTLSDFEEFPVPHESVPEMIKSLVATFSLMRQAKEDVVNDNIDIV